MNAASASQSSSHAFAPILSEVTVKITTLDIIKALVPGISRDMPPIPSILARRAGLTQEELHLPPWHITRAGNAESCGIIAPCTEEEAEVLKAQMAQLAPGQSHSEEDLILDLVELRNGTTEDAEGVPTVEVAPGWFVHLFCRIHDPESAYPDSPKDAVRAWQELL